MARRRVSPGGTLGNAQKGAGTGPSKRRLEWLSRRARTSGTLPAMRPEVADEVGRWLRAARVPGCAIATVRRGGEATTTGFGDARLAPRTPVNDATRFHLFSGTKLYTATALMRLVERGAVDLDAPVGAYLPELPLRHPVRVGQLAAHDSGLPDTLKAFLAIHPGAERGPTAEAALSRYRLDRGAAPDGRARYRNVGFAILGALVSRVAGVPFERFVTDEVLAPLGADLRFDHPPELRDTTAAGHLGRWSPMRLALPLLLPDASRWIHARTVDGLVELAPFALDTAAIGGLIGPAPAYLPLLTEMLSEDDGLLTRASKQAMLTLRARGAAGVMSRDGVGLGWKRGTVDGVTFWNHEGGGPGFCSETRLYLDAGLGVVVLMNRSQTSALSRLCHRIAERLRRP